MVLAAMVQGDDAVKQRNTETHDKAVYKGSQRVSTSMRYSPEQRTGDGEVRAAAQLKKKKKTA